MHKRLSLLLAAALFLGSLFGCQSREETPSVRIRRDIEFLCSDECNGRLPGSDGNELARDYIEKAFEQAELIPLEGCDSLLVPYQQTVFDMDQKQILTAVFSDGSTKTFQSGTDFYPCLDLTMDGGFSGKTTTNPADPDLIHKIYMARDGGRDVDAAAMVLESNQGSASLINAGAAPLLLCNSSVFEQIVKCESLSLEGTVIPQEMMVDNVVGVLPSESGAAQDALLITAHFDHVGGYGDTIYRGALDNASGVALLLEVMRQLAFTGNKTSYDIVFAAFNGEDMGLRGSSALASQLPYLSVNVINFDCVGYKDESTLGVVGEDKELQTAVISALNDSIPCVRYDDAPSSDHNSFEKQGIPAVTVSNYFGEVNIVDIIHQTTDIPDILDFESIAAMVDPICEYALAGSLIQPKPHSSEQENNESMILSDWDIVYARAREKIDADGVPYDQVLPIQLDGKVFFVRDISFLANIDAAEASIPSLNPPESLGRFQLDRSASLYGYGNEEEYHVKVRMIGSDEDYEIGVPQKITNEYDEIRNWCLTYTDGEIFLTLATLDKEHTDVESVMSDWEQAEIQVENGTLYQQFHTWEEKRILLSVYYLSDDFPYYYVLHNSRDNSTAVDDDTMLQMMIDAIPALREIPKFT